MVILDSEASGLQAQSERQQPALSEGEERFVKMVNEAGLSRLVDEAGQLSERGLSVSEKIVEKYSLQMEGIADENSDSLLFVTVAALAECASACGYLSENAVEDEENLRKALDVLSEDVFSRVVSAYESNKERLSLKLPKEDESAIYNKGSVREIVGEMDDGKNIGRGKRGRSKRRIAAYGVLATTAVTGVVVPAYVVTHKAEAKAMAKSAVTSISERLFANDSVSQGYFLNWFDRLEEGRSPSVRELATIVTNRDGIRRESEIREILRRWEEKDERDERFRVVHNSVEAGLGFVDPAITEIESANRGFLHPDRDVVSVARASIEKTVAPALDERVVQLARRYDLSKEQIPGLEMLFYQGTYAIAENEIFRDQLNGEALFGSENVLTTLENDQAREQFFAVLGDRPERFIGALLGENEPEELFSEFVSLARAAEGDLDFDAELVRGQVLLDIEDWKRRGMETQLMRLDRLLRTFDIAGHSAESVRWLISYSDLTLNFLTWYESKGVSIEDYSEFALIRRQGVIATFESEGVDREWLWDFSEDLGIGMVEALDIVSSMTGLEKLGRDRSPGVFVQNLQDGAELLRSFDLTGAFEQMTVRERSAYFRVLQYLLEQEGEQSVRELVGGFNLDELDEIGTVFDLSDLLANGNSDGSIKKREFELNTRLVESIKDAYEQKPEIYESLFEMDRRVLLVNLLNYTTEDYERFLRDLESAMEDFALYENRYGRGEVPEQRAIIFGEIMAGRNRFSEAGQLSDTILPNYFESVRNSEGRIIATFARVDPSSVTRVIRSEQERLSAVDNLLEQYNSPGSVVIPAYSMEFFDGTIAFEKGVDEDPFLLRHQDMNAPQSRVRVEDLSDEEFRALTADGQRHLVLVGADGNVSVRRYGELGENKEDALAAIENSQMAWTILPVYFDGEFLESSDVGFIQNHQRFEFIVTKSGELYVAFVGPGDSLSGSLDDLEERIGDIDVIFSSDPHISAAVVGEDQRIHTVGYSGYGAFINARLEARGGSED